MKKIITGFIIICLWGCAQSPESPEGRALEFTRNLYSGKAMKAEDWLAKDARSSKLSNAFGGIDAAVGNSSAEAERNRGLQSVRIKSVKKQGEIVFIEFEVIFNNKEISNGIDPWILEDGKWKITRVDNASNHGE